MVIGRDRLRHTRMISRIIWAIVAMIEIGTIISYAGLVALVALWILGEV